MILLKKPTIAYQTQIQEYKSVFIERQEMIHGSSDLDKFQDIDKWIDQARRNESRKTVQFGYVPALTFMAILEKEDKVVGLINIRLELNDYLKQFGGHIGYSVHPLHRRHGYAKAMLRQALMICKDEGLEKVLITADDDNIGSYKTIEASGGVLEDKIKQNNQWIRRYWIDLKNQ